MKMMPTGFRFNPTDEELIEILKKKVYGQEMPLHGRFIVTRNVYEFDPQDLQWDHNMVTSNNERYCYCIRETDSREVSGRGWWRATGHVKKIYINEDAVGYRRPLTFHRFMDNDRKRDKAMKTNWIMHEYSLASNMTEWRLCKIKYRGKPSLQEELESSRRDYTSRNYFEDSSSIMAMQQPNFVSEQQQQQELFLHLSNVSEPYFEPSSSTTGIQQFSHFGEEQRQSQSLQLDNVYEPYFTQNYTQLELIDEQQHLPQASYDHPYYFDYQLQQSDSSEQLFLM